MPKLLLKGGLEANLPVLSEREPAITTDTKKVFVGSSSGNVELAKKSDVDAHTVTLGTKANQSDLDAANTNIALKANQSDLDTTNANLAETMNYLADIGVNVKKNGAIGDGVTNDTVALTSAISFLESVGGGSLYLPDDGVFLCDALTLTKRTTIFGKGTILSKSTGAALKIVPNANSNDSTFWRLRDFEIKPQVDGSGTYGVEIVLNTGAYFSNFEIDGIKIRNFGLQGLKLNNEIANANGFFTGTIRRCWIQNGIHAPNIGDSVTISENTITGRNTGILASCVSGAAQLVIKENNITTVGGAIALINPAQSTIRNNQCEHPVGSGDYTGAYNSYIYLQNPSYCKVIENNINPAAGTIVAGDYGVKLDGGTRSLLRDNVISKGKLYHVGFVGTNHMYGEGNSCGTTPVFEDLGTGTYGVKRTLTLQNAWVEYDATSTPTVKKTENGLVIVSGTIKSGTVTSNTILFTLPTGFIPLKLKRFSVMCFNGTTYSQGIVYVNPSGNVTIVAGVNGMFSLDGISFYTD